MRNNVPNILYSYYYIYQMNRQGAIAEAQDRHPDKRWFLDSGAFTYWRKYEEDPTALMNWKQYKKLYFNYIEDTWQRWDRIAELDLDDMFEDLPLSTLAKWRDEMAERWPDANIMPVWHGGRGMEEWARYCKDPRFRHLAIGSGLPRSLTGLRRRMINEARANGKTTHLFGMTRINTVLPHVHPDSIDSTSWLSGQKFGTVFIFQHNKFKLLSGAGAGKKASRKRYATYFKNIGCNAKLVIEDDQQEVRKANIIAWRRLSDRLEEMRKRQRRSFVDGDVEAGYVWAPGKEREE